MAETFRGSSIKGKDPHAKCFSVSRRLFPDSLHIVGERKGKMSRSIALCLVALVVASTAASTMITLQQVPEKARADAHGFFPQVARSHTIKPAGTAVVKGKALSIALDFVQKALPGLSWEVANHYVTKHNGVTHVYLKQEVNGIPVFNGDLNINVDKNGRILNMGESFFRGQTLDVITKPTITALEALRAFADFLGLDASAARTVRNFNATHARLADATLALSEIPANLVYVYTEEGDLELSWHLNLERVDEWFDVAIGASSRPGSTLALANWVNSASYYVYPIGVNDPDDGDRELLVNPHSDESPLGWHDQGNGNTFTDTRGNNVYAQENLAGGSSWENNYRPDGGDELVFDFPIDFTQEPEEYLDAAITNLFYWNNIIHDVTYVYGFDEVSGNFQENNFDLGGKGNDAVQANAQDGAGYNNANFATPPDGSRPRMRMYVWTTESPMLDGDLDNGIIIHEYAHGISNRLTGGPANSNCLSTSEAGGMGEGWGDCYSIALRWREEYDNSTVFGMGEYAAGDGIRLYDYATNMTINPQTYGYINGAQYGGVHAKGTVWCTMLYDVFHVYTDLHGFDADWYEGQSGSQRFLQNFIDGMKFQPCNPSFVDARDAFLLAEETNYNGENYCEVWEAFARRGLGVSAVSSRRKVTEAFDIPAECEA